MPGDFWRSPTAWALINAGFTDAELLSLFNKIQDEEGSMLAVPGFVWPLRTRRAEEGHDGTRCRKVKEEDVTVAMEH